MRNNTHRTKTRAATSRVPHSTTRRVTDVLSVFLDGRESAGVTQIAREIEVSKSVAHRILRMLVSVGFIGYVPATRQYRLGAKMLRLGLLSARMTELGTTSLPYLRAIKEKTGETALLAVLQGDRRVFLEQITSAHTVRAAVPIGEEAVLYLGASGKAMLAFVPRSLRDAILQAARGQRRADRSVVRISELLAELEEIRHRRYATAANELASGAAAVASPIFDADGRVIGSLGVAGVSTRTDARRLLLYASVVKTEAERLSRALGWDGQVRSD